MNDNKSTVMNNAAVQQLRKVPGFDPMKLLRKTISVKTGHPVWKLDLRYKRLWFRLACPNGRMLLKPLRISDQLAIIEAQVYFSKDDPVPAASFTSEQRRENVPGGEFLRAAQEDALNMALENAGFGIQFCDVSRDYGGELFGSEVPVQTEVEEAAVEETKALIAEETAAETAPTMDMDSAPTEQHVAETTASDVQTVTDGFTSVAADVQQEQSVSAAQEEVPDLHVLPPQQEEAAEEVAEQPQAASYTADMDVSEITQRNGHDVDAAKVGAGEIQSHVILGLNPGLINASGYSWTGDYVTVTGDLCADLLSNIASEQRAKVVYEYLYRQIDDKKVRQTIDFLLNREEAHNQMFRDAFNAVQNSGSNQDFGTTKAAKKYFSI